MLHSWPSTSPPFRVSEDTARFKDYDRHNMRSTIRMSRAILETFKLGFGDVRWFVKVDDDTVVFVDNLVEVLTKYDHTGYYYIGGSSESIGQNAMHSFSMAFGGAGFAVSYPLAKALARNIDGCLKRYPTLYGEDHLIQFCSAELGVSLTSEPGFHQIDMRGDISGFLSAHPQSPLVSLHHLGSVDPIFPHMSRHDALRHLMNAEKVDSSRLLQQIICYDRENRWSISISWGYSVHVYEELHPPALLQIPLQTFRSWNNRARPAFMFNVRPISTDPCAMPHVFYLESVEDTDSNQIVSNYIRRNLWKLSSCHNHSAESIYEIKVFTPTKRLQWGGRRRECCEVNNVSSTSSVELTVRDCEENEALNWSHLS